MSTKSMGFQITYESYGLRELISRMVHKRICFPFNTRTHPTTTPGPLRVQHKVDIKIFPAELGVEILQFTWCAAPREGYITSEPVDPG